MNLKKIVTGLFITGIVATTSLVAFADTSKVSESIKAVDMIPLENILVLSDENIDGKTISMGKLTLSSADNVNLGTGLYIDGKEITFEEIASGILKDETKIMGIKDKNGNYLTVKTDEDGLTQIIDKEGNPAKGVFSNVVSAFVITENAKDDNIDLIKLEPATK